MSKNDLKAKAEKEIAKKAKEKYDEKTRGEKYKVKSTLGFEKRNYNIDGVNILLVAGEEVGKDLVEMFNQNVQDAFFEKV